MDDKNFCLIIGASSGIGLEISKELSAKGKKLVIVSSNEKKLSYAHEILEGDGHFKVVCDLSNPSNIKALFDKIENMEIMLDGMVYCAGISPLCMLKDNSIDLMYDVFGVNFFSFVEAVKFFQSENISVEGSNVIAISSITARGAGYRQTLYGASKAAMIASVKLMANELLNRNIKINCVSPGVTDTPLLDDLRLNSNDLDAKIRNSQPLGIITTKSIAKVVNFILNDGGSEFTTGMEWTIDGGALLK